MAKGLIIFISMVLLLACKSDNSDQIETIVTVESEEKIPLDIPWSERMALSIMKRAPIAWKNDFQTKPTWTYTIGLVLNSMCKVSAAKQNVKYFDYAKGYGDTMIYNDGSIRNYNIADFNIDNIAPGPYLMTLYKKTGEERYKTAINTLHHQLSWQPKTSEGGYWHKLRYPWQMWLDGLFMGEPFMAEYAQMNNQSQSYDHIAHQFILSEKYMRDPQTGLLYHGWDESRIQKWSNPQTGCSPHFWGRAIGWYCMGLVDVLDYFPKDHPQREVLIAILNRTLEAVLKVRDSHTNTWWQIMNYPHKEGNYLESTGSCMFTYAMIRGANQGYLDEAYALEAQKCYDGLINNFIKVDDDGEIHLTQGCSVAGLGGDPYRDGSYEYYISEPVRDNDPKGIGPFMLASLEIERIKSR